MSQISIDLTTLPGWDSLPAGDYDITVGAKADGYTRIIPSTSVSVEKLGPLSATYFTFDQNQYITGFSTAGQTAYDNDEITDLRLPETYSLDGADAIDGNDYQVLGIGNNAFMSKNNILSLSMSNSVTSIGNSAFSGCINLESIVLPNNLVSIGNQAFYNCRKIQTFSLPESVTTIGVSTFAYCQMLSSINIPQSVTSISSTILRGCINLASITVNPNNSVYDSRNNCNAIIETSTNTLIAGCKNTTIPNNVTTIGQFALADCSSLTSITIPNSVTHINDMAFLQCVNLTSINIPDSVTFINSDVFAGCNNLTSIIVDLNNSKYDSRDNCNAIIETATNKLLIGCKNTVIPNTITSIGSYAFDGCTYLTGITLPDTITSIGNYAFMDCSNLISITIPSNVTNIWNYAFSGCQNLLSITITATTPPTLANVNAFSNTNNCPIYVPAASVTDYQTASKWSTYASRIQAIQE